MNNEYLVMGLKDKIFLRRLSKQPERQTRFPHMERPLRVLIIYESDILERNDAIKAIRQDLLRQQMDTTLWGFVDKKEVVSLILPQSRILGPKDYTIWGTPDKQTLRDLQAEHYDLLLDLTTHPCLPLRYLALYAEADFKVGLNLGEGVHDMLLSPPELNTEEAKPEATWLYNLILQYLSTIRSND